MTVTISDDKISMWKHEVKSTLGNEAWAQITLNEIRLENDGECMMFSYGILVNAETVSGSTSRRQFNEQDCELFILFLLFAVSQLTPKLYLLFSMCNVKIIMSLQGRPEAA